MAHKERDRLPLDSYQPVRMILPEEDIFRPPLPADIELDLNNHWVKHAVNELSGQMGRLHGVVLRNQWLMLVALGVETVLVLVLAAMVWSVAAAS